jgi:DNA-binding response OmpR family regulator
MTKILLIEDDKTLAEILKQALEAQHYLVDWSPDGETGWEYAESIEYDLVLLDLVLPRLDGISLCKRLRTKLESSQQKPTAILLLTAQSDTEQKVIGLDAGADDYLVKPVDLQELFARVRALLRRNSGTRSLILTFGKLHLNTSSYEVTYDDQLLDLTPKEYRLLELFLRNQQRVFSQHALIDHLWESDTFPGDTAVRSQIKLLRKKLKQVGAENLIETVYGLGYRLKPIDQELQAPFSIAKDAVSQNSSVTLKASEYVLPEFAEIWQNHRQKYFNQVFNLRQIIEDLLINELSQETRKKAGQQAHTLIGSLGSFGFIQAAQCARQIEQTLKENESLSRSQIQQLLQFVTTLQQSLEEVPVTPVEPLKPSLPSSLCLLIIDDDAGLVDQLVVEATHWGVQTEVAANLIQARQRITEACPDVVLLDLTFPNAADNGLELLAEIKALQPQISVIVFTAQNDFAIRVKVAQLGGQRFLQKPLTPQQVLAAVTQMPQLSTLSKSKLMIVDDDPQVLDTMRSLLEPWNFQLTLADNLRQFWETLEQCTPDLLILDLEMPEISGIDLCQVVRNDLRWIELPILVLSAYTDRETVQQVFMAGADDYITKPVVGAELLTRVLNRLERIQILRRLAQTSKPMS